jgi:DNA-binding transcriptional ArsR family regulator
MSAPPDLDKIFQSLSDGTRRGIVERLRAAPETTGELARAFPSLSRVAVMKHLDVLEEAGLVEVRREGRFRWNALKSEPLLAADTWLARHIERRRDMLLRLKAIAEEGEGDE